MAPSISSRDREILERVRRHLTARVQGYSGLVQEVADQDLRNILMKAIADGRDAITMLQWAKGDQEQDPPRRVYESVTTRKPHSQAMK